jgi:hypothetical protein
MSIVRGEKNLKDLPIFSLPGRHAITANHSLSDTA